MGLALFYLFLKDFHLDILWRKISVEIQPAFANCYAFRVASQFLNNVVTVVCPSFGVMGMDAFLKTFVY